MTHQAVVDESPFMSFLAPQIRYWQEDQIEIALQARPEFCNRSGVLHGGVIAAILDHVGGMCGLFCEDPNRQRHCVTLNLNVNYVGQAKSGLLVATGQRIRGGRKIYFARMQLTTESGDILATGTGVFRYRSGSET